RWDVSSESRAKACVSRKRPRSIPIIPGATQPAGSCPTGGRMGGHAVACVTLRSHRTGCSTGCSINGPSRAAEVPGNLLVLLSNVEAVAKFHPISVEQPIGRPPTAKRICTSPPARDLQQIEPSKEHGKRGIYQQSMADWLETQQYTK